MRSPNLPHPAKAKSSLLLGNSNERTGSTLSSQRHSLTHLAPGYCTVRVTGPVAVIAPEVPVTVTV
jgi:hypothetical protein